MENTEPKTGNEDLTAQLISKILNMSEDQKLLLNKQLESAAGETPYRNERRNIRKGLTKAIQFSSKNRNFTGICEDISESGTFIKTEDRFSIGQLMDIMLPVYGNGGQIKVSGQVVRIVPGGIGVEFLKKLK